MRRNKKMETKINYENRTEKTPADTPLICCSVRENISSMDLENKRNTLDNPKLYFHVGSGNNLSRNTKSSISARVFVLGVDGKPLTPCKPQKAKKLLDEMIQYYENRRVSVQVIEFDFHIPTKPIAELIHFIYQQKLGTELGRTFAEIKIVYIRELPIINLDLKNKTDKSAHDKIVRLVSQMLEAKKKLGTSKMDRDINYYERKCSNIDREINNEVYKLYGLTKGEIEIINSD